MREFLELLQKHRAPVMMVSRVRELVGEDSLAALQEAGVFVPAELARWWPCDGSFGHGCPRRVVPNPGWPQAPYAAVCGRQPRACETVLLTEEDLQQVTVSEPRLLGLLGDLFGIEPEAAPDETAFPGTVLLGRTYWRAEERQVFLAFHPWQSGFSAFLQVRRYAAMPSLVLAPCRWHVPVSLADSFGPGELVELVFLEDVLAVEDGEVVRRQAHPVAGAHGRTAPEEKPACVLLDQSGRHTLTAAEYRTHLDRLESFDLALDLTKPAESGRYRAGRRTAQGTFEEAHLARNQAVALAELISRGRPLQPREICDLGVSQPWKVIEAARRLVDVKQARFGWRAIHTIKMGTPHEKQYLFGPPDGFTYAIFLPLAGPVAPAPGCAPPFIPPSRPADHSANIS